MSDHPGLHAAAKTGAPVICLYVLDDAAGRAPGVRRAGSWCNRCARWALMSRRRGGIARPAQGIGGHSDP
ncbi:deoxyribodipyrimidine photo-lyase [Bradyrhizobium sp. Gha]|uniref:deoxyribodipyrimidine photo-lyase n=1 Tax=Bradyrhizobium sp. Gha TaxID=1855318 RepID=UPI0024C0D542|nr:deoxyribodipyrimidine photo-lyase [Bradyrhizobium sp. Gha]